MSISLITGGVAALILTFLLVDFLWLAFRKKQRGRASIPEKKEPYENPKSDFYALEEADPGAMPVYAVIDFQTTGLSTKAGEEDRIIQVAWLVVDRDFRVIKRRLSLVRQTRRSAYEAQMVHHIPFDKIMEYGLPESEVLGDLLGDLSEGVALVFHNAAFDLGILRGALRKCGLCEWDDLARRQVFCTMTFLPELRVGTAEEKFLSLPNLTAQLTGRPVPKHSFPDTFTAWRNVCLTRICLRRLSELYPDTFPRHLRPVSEILE